MLSPWHDLAGDASHAAADKCPVLCTQYTDPAANPVALTLQEFLEPGGAGTGGLLPMALGINMICI